MFLGIISGLCSAFLQSTGYVFSRMCVRKGMSAFRLLVCSQILTGLFSCAVLPFVWHDFSIFDRSFLLPFSGCFFGSSLGAYFFYRAENFIGPSRIASLMGLRIVTVAVVSAIWRTEHYNYLQILAILLAVLSAVVMNFQNGRLQMKGMGSLGLMFLCLLASDISIKYLTKSVGLSNVFHASFLATVLLGVALFVFFLPAAFMLKRSDYKDTLPYSCVLFFKQIFLFTCFASIGPVYGNIVMSFRGPIAIAITYVLLRFNVKNLEPQHSKNIWIRRLVATFMMIFAIILYSVE